MPLETNFGVPEDDYDVDYAHILAEGKVLTHPAVVAMEIAFDLATTGTTEQAYELIRDNRSVLMPNTFGDREFGQAFHAFMTQHERLIRYMVHTFNVAAERTIEAKIEEWASEADR